MIRDFSSSFFLPLRGGVADGQVSAGGRRDRGNHSPEIQILEGRQIQVWFRDGSGDERGRRVGRAVAAFRMSQLPLFERLDGIRPGVTGPRR